VVAAGILAAALGLLISAACILMPLLVACGSDPRDDADTLAYEDETGRSARDIALDNAVVRARQENDARR